MQNFPFSPTAPSNVLYVKSLNITVDEYPGKPSHATVPLSLACQSKKICPRAYTFNSLFDLCDRKSGHLATLMKCPLSMLAESMWESPIGLTLTLSGCLLAVLLASQKGGAGWRGRGEEKGYCCVV